MQDLLEGVVDLGAPAQALGEGGGTHGHDHELLEVDVVVGMHAAVEDVHHRHGQGVGVGAAQVGVQRQVHRVGGSAGAGHGGAQDGVGAQAGLVLGAVEVDEHGVDLALAGGVLAHEGVGDLLVHMVDCGEHALAQVAGAIGVTHLAGLEGAGGSAARHAGAAEGAVVKGHLDLDRGVAARVKNLTAVHIDDRAHSSVSFSLAWAHRASWSWRETSAMSRPSARAACSM